VFAGVRNPADGTTLAASASPRLMPIGLDVTDAASIAAAVHTVRAIGGENGLAGLVNNAGIGIVGPVEALLLSEWRRQFDVNVFGLIAVTQAFLPLLRQARGRVINMGSMAGRAATPFMAPYSASKYALEGLNDSLRIELQPWGIDVALIEPGAIAPPIWGKTRNAVDALDMKWNPEMKTMYLTAFTLVKERATQAGQSAPAPGIVVQAVVHALRSRFPKTRYLVGRDAKVRTLLAAVLPDRLHDWLLTRILKLPARR
jgi:NAD(P)-dependent dehydrogenase (short-subunit alcohol dehydrogenase family)